MFWPYLLVFLGTLLFDIVPFPFPPAFTVMVFLQMLYDLDLLWVLIIGVAGSVSGRYILLLYAPIIGRKYLKDDKNEDIQFLGKKMEENKWKGMLIVVAYSLLPLPTTPLFLGAGISKIKAIYIVPAFLVGKTISDAAALYLGSYAAQNKQNIIDNAFSVNSIMGLLLAFFLLFCLFFINWRVLIQHKKLELDFKIFK